MIGSTVCLLCPPGFECPFTNMAPLRCPVGTYSLSGEAQCQRCSIGHSCNSNDMLPTPCPIGWFSQEGEAMCTPCYPGYFCPSEDAPLGLPILCPEGYYSIEEGNTICTLCPAGHKCPNRTQIPEPCPPGFFASTGLQFCLSVNQPIILRIK